MKVEELMVGDKVVSKRIECVGDGGQYQEWMEFGEIIRILEDTVYVMFDKQKDDWEEIEIKDIQPIPLTHEILEKNGFERRDDLIGDDNFLPFVFERLDTDECFEIIIYWRDSYCNGAADAFNEVSWDEYWKLHILSSPSLYEYETENCIYVHELQHALKLCKIQKDVML